MGLRHADFMAQFDQWAPTYDATVWRAEPADGFESYAEILRRVADEAGAGPGQRILDVGAGTGNLTLELARRGAAVVAVEPSEAMRAEAGRKLGEIPVVEGQFLSIPAENDSVDAIVSTYAFHHLTDEEKRLGVAEMLRVLRPGGRMVLGDIAWADEESRAAMIRRFEREGKLELVKEIEEEYYPTIGMLTAIFAAAGCPVYVERLTEWVWLLVARKRG